MAKLIAVVLLILSVAMVVPAAALAQAPQAPEGYIIQKEDTLWELSGFHKGDPRLWREIVAANPFLSEPGRIFERGGKIIALIRPGEKLAGLEALGILPKVLPASALKPEDAGAGAVFPWYLSTYPLWAWLLIAALWALVIIGAIAVIRQILMRYRQHRLDPATAGPAFVEPTVPRTPELISGRFASMATEAAARRDPVGMRADVRPERIGPIESGFLTGRGRVSYADGSSRDLALNRERAYRARYRMPDGSEEVLYSLAGCMNPVNLFREDRTFAWTIQEVAVPLLRPVQSEPTAPAPLRVVSETPGPTVVSVGDLEFTVPHGSSVSVDAQGRVSIVPTAGTILVSRKAKAKRVKPKVVRPAAGTGSQLS